MNEQEHSCTEIRSEGVHQIVTLKDECFVDDDHIRQAGRDLREIVDDMKGKFLLINFQNIKLLGSSMIGQLIQLRNKCATSGVTLQISDLQTNVAEAIGMMNLNELLNVFETEEAAIAAATE